MLNFLARNTATVRERERRNKDGKEIRRERERRLCEEERVGGSDFWIHGLGFHSSGVAPYLTSDAHYWALNIVMCVAFLAHPTHIAVLRRTLVKYDAHRLSFASILCCMRHKWVFCDVCPVVRCRWWDANRLSTSATMEYFLQVTNYHIVIFIRPELLINSLKGKIFNVGSIL